MLHINMHTTWPQIGINYQLSSSAAHSVPAQVNGRYVAPQNDQFVTAATVDINTYPSRKAYGFCNMDDFTRENGAKGLQSIQERTSRFTREAWELADNAAKKDGKGPAYCIRMYQNQFKGRFMESFSKHLELVNIPDPIFTPHVSEIEGGIDPGISEASVETKKDGAVVNYTPGSIEVYLKQQGSLDIWTEGSVDTFA